MNNSAPDSLNPIPTLPEHPSCGGCTIAADSNPVPPAPIPIHPTWTDISTLFVSPLWVPEPDRVRTGASWIRAMGSYNLDLTSYSDVQSQAITIYQHLRSQAMPLTDNPADYFPDWALEMIRVWVNEGYRKATTDPIIQGGNIIPPPLDPVQPLRVRKDLCSLTPEELTTYRERLALLGVGDVKGKWQELGLLHTNWCLHYQEATFPWHRAYLLFIEGLLGCPIPYWNGFAAAAADPTSPHAGLPQVFLDDTFMDSRGTLQQNPMKYACALGGKSKLGGGLYVTRDPILVAGKSNDQWAGKVAQFTLYQSQILLALQQWTYSEPANVTQEAGHPFGAPWANIPMFSADGPDCWYPYRGDFDGLFEQPHDNYHGWVGGDMADNTYTAFDPVFLSYHANLDRLVEKFLQDPKSRGLTFTANFPLQPFMAQASEISYSDPRKYLYTTIGDMTKNTKALGYTYGEPAEADATETPSPNPTAAPCPGFSTTAAEGTKPFVLFTPVNCITKSYQIDMYAPGASAHDLNPDNPFYIGRETRIGMGSGERGTGPKNRDRCIQRGITRILDASRVAENLSTNTTGELVQVVTDLETRAVVPETEWSTWGGFRGKLVWGTGNWGM